MKIKYIAAIFIYFVTFTLSVLIVGMPVSQQSRSYKKPCVNNAPPVVSTETELQVRIRKFLEADLQTGIELTNDKVRLSNSNSRFEAKRLATLNLLEKMKKVECGEGLPKDFCMSWEEHLSAWSEYADFLNKGGVGTSHMYKRFNNKIDLTYQNMVAVARKYEVDFKY